MTQKFNLTNEMFTDDLLNNLPDNPLDSVKQLIDGYIEFVEHTQFKPLTHYEQCVEGYALISTLNQNHNLGLDLLSVSPDDREGTILALNNSIQGLKQKLLH